MTTARFFSLLLLCVTLMTTLTSCDTIGGLMKYSFYAGIIAVVFVIAIIWWLVTKMGGGSGNA